MAKISDIVGNHTLQLLGWDGSKKEVVAQRRAKKLSHKRKGSIVKKSKKSRSSFVGYSRANSKRQIVGPNCVKCGRKCTARTQKDSGPAICDPCAYVLQQKAGHIPQPPNGKKKKKYNVFVRISYSAFESNRRKH